MNNLVNLNLVIVLLLAARIEAQSFTPQTASVSAQLNSEAIETNLSNAVNNDDIGGLDAIPMQIRKLELFGPKPHPQEQRERIWNLRLKFFRAVRQFEDCAKTHHQEQHSTATPQSPSPTIARAYVFPALESELITNALLRQQFDRYREANETRRKNIYRERRLKSLAEATFDSLLEMIDAAPLEQRGFVFPAFTRHVIEIFPQGDDRNLLLALIPPITPNS
jgi:hypothetical protein